MAFSWLRNLMSWLASRYKQFSLKFYTILMAHADDVQAVSVDEALIETTSAVARYRAEHPDCEDPAKDFAELIRDKVRAATGCEGAFKTLPYSSVYPVLTSRDTQPASE
jgi:DNA repair protein REV1